jgi:hypothetical protein
MKHSNCRRTRFPTLCMRYEEYITWIWELSSVVRNNVIAQNQYSAQVNWRRQSWSVKATTWVRGLNSPRILTSALDSGERPASLSTRSWLTPEPAWVCYRRKHFCPSREYNSSHLFWSQSLTELSRFIHMGYDSGWHGKHMNWQYFQHNDSNSAKPFAEWLVLSASSSIIWTVLLVGWEATCTELRPLTVATLNFKYCNLWRTAF